MFAPGWVRARNVRRVPIAAVMPPVAAVMVLVGCSSGGDPPVAVSTSPPLSAPAAGGSPTAVPSSASPRDAVTAAYHGYWAAAQKAATQSPAQARQTLAPYSTPGLIENQLKGISRLQAKNQEPWGQVKIHIYAIDVQGSTARLSDCQDGSGSGLADRRTHQLIPGTRGSTQPYNLSVTLQRGSDGRWRVSAVRTVENPCTRPGPSGA
jgi:hypothetical protein